MQSQRLLVTLVTLLICSCASSHPGYEAERMRLAALSDAYFQQQQARVDRIGRFLTTRTVGAGDSTFTVDRNAEKINAFAYPNGGIVITYGMLQFLESDDELAAVLGHEIAHVVKGHYKSNLAGNLLSTVAAVAVEVAAPGMGAGRAVQQLGSGIVNHFNQAQELEADSLGQQYVAYAGYDPEAATRVFERMAIRLPQTLTADFFSTHPSSPERTMQAHQNALSLRAQGYGSQAVSNAIKVSNSSLPPPSTTPGFITPGVPAPPQWTAQNPTSETDTQLRNAEREFRAGKMSLEEFREIKRVLQEKE